MKLLDLTKFHEWAAFPKLQKWKNRMEKLPHYEDSMGKHVRKYGDMFRKQTVLTNA